MSKRALVLHVSFPSSTKELYFSKKRILFLFPSTSPISVVSFSIKVLLYNDYFVSFVKNSCFMRALFPHLQKRPILKLSFPSFVKEHYLMGLSFPSPLHHIASLIWERAQF